MQVAIECKLECKVRRPKVFTETFTLPTQTSGDLLESEFSFDLAPIHIDDKVTFNKDMMSDGEWYPFSYNDKEYLAVKTNNTIDIYRIKK